MARVLLLLVVFATLAAWAGAQGPAAPLPAADRVKLLKLNRPLLEQMVNHGIDLSGTDEPLPRAKKCRETAQTLANYLDRAANTEQDPDRVAELADLIGTVVREGLTPNLEVGRQLYPPGSPDAARLTDVQKLAVADLDSIGSSIPAGKVGDSKKVQEALARLAGLKSDLGK